MTTEQAIKILDEVTAMMKLSRDEHKLVLEALRTLTEKTKLNIAKSQEEQIKAV